MRERELNVVLTRKIFQDNSQSLTTEDMGLRGPTTLSNHIAFLAFDPSALDLVKPCSLPLSPTSLVSAVGLFEGQILTVFSVPSRKFSPAR